MSTPHDIRTLLTGFPRRLTWASFPTVDRSRIPPLVALTSSTFRLSGWRAVLEKGQYRPHGFHITVSFNAAASWATRTGRTDDLLRHEQGHLDITGLCARDLAANLLDLQLDAEVVLAAAGSGKTLAEHLLFAQRQLQLSVEQYGRQANDLLGKLQSNRGVDGLYDRQTNHGANKAAQAIWETRLAHVTRANENFALSLSMMGVV